MLLNKYTYRQLKHSGKHNKPIEETNNTYHYPVRYILLVSGVAAAAEKVIYCKKSGSIYGSCSGIEVH